MSNAKIDQNNRGTAICASKLDGQTVVPLKADGSTHALLGNTNASVDNGNNNGNAMLDENSKPVFMALSSTGDGSLVEVYADPATGAILLEL